MEGLPPAQAGLTRHRWAHAAQGRARAPTGNEWCVSCRALHLTIKGRTRSVPWAGPAGPRLRAVLHGSLRLVATGGYALNLRSISSVSVSPWAELRPVSTKPQSPYTDFARALSRTTHASTSAT